MRLGRFRHIVGCLQHLRQKELRTDFFVYTKTARQNTEFFPAPDGLNFMCICVSVFLFFLFLFVFL